MRIINGSRRKVFVFDNFVIKLPRTIYWIWIAYQRSFCGYKHYPFKRIIRIIIKFFGLIFGPMKDNWSEFIFYQKTHHNFCAKTYFSLFGLFNIQERVVLLEEYDSRRQYEFKEYSKYKELIIKAIRDNNILDSDGYTFLNPYNFGMSNKNQRFTCFDYEDTLVQKNIIEHGDKIQEVFKDYNKEQNCQD